MANYTLNPAIITGSLGSMPQITSRATTAGTGIDTSTLDPSIYGGSGLTGSGFDWSSIMNAINDFVGSPLGQGIGSLGTSIINNLFDNYRAKQQREWNEQMMDKQNAFSLDMWNKTNEYNSPAAQKQRLIDAGMNPLYYGLDGSSANSFESAQPLSYDRSTMPLLSNPMPAMLDARVKQAQIENIEAQTDRTRSETDQTYLENQFLKKTLDVRIEAESTKLELDKAKVNEVKELTRKYGVEINKIIEETNTELVKQILYQTEAALKEGELYRLKVLLPLEANLLRARTEAEQAQASWFVVQASVENLKIDSGYYESIIDKAKAEARTETAKAELAEFQNAVRSGNANKLGQWFNNHPNWKAAHPALAFLSGDLFKFSSMLKESGIYQAIGIATGAAAVGAKAASKAPAAGQPGGSPKYPTLYGSDGKPIMYN